ncbi:MAG: glycosyltransferase family 1 protein [Propionibacteriaceae bacterium]|nr:glycosyltransferase family 1 protein [Propionibacteriaceae bacterium]
MKIAVHYENLTIDEDGSVGGHEAGDTLVRRLLRVFPGAVLIGDPSRSQGETHVVPIDQIDGATTVVINMDVLNSMQIYSWMKAHGCAKPRIMNFVWWEAARYPDPVQVAELALSCAVFPTFTNSHRTTRSIEELVKRWVVRPIAERAAISGVNLGIRMEHVQERVATPVPVVLYPAIYMDARKQPNLFIDVVSKVVKRTPILVEARLAASGIITDPAMRLSRERWAKVGPLLPSRSQYWASLARTTAFLATAQEESYGLEYVEALVAGAVGVFPDKEWAHAILPEGYPFFYTSAREAEDLLVTAVTDPDGCRRAIDEAAGEPFAQWLDAHHSDDQFEAEIARHVQKWFGTAL